MSEEQASLAITPDTHCATLVAGHEGRDRICKNLGDAAASYALHRSLHDLSMLMREHGGYTRHFRDYSITGCLPTVSSALRVAATMQQEATSDRQRYIRDHGAGDLFIGIHYGVIGDAAGIAHKVANLSRGRTILISQEAREAAPGEYWHAVRGIERGYIVDAGVSRPVFEFTWMSAGDVVGDNILAFSNFRPEHLSLVSANTTTSLSRSSEQPRLHIGRTDDNDFAFTADAISRRHAEILYDAGQFSVRDTSKNGTWIRTDAGDLHVIGETKVLPPAGTLSFGAPLEECDGAYIQFRAE